MCWSFDFGANEFQVALNGEVFKKVKDGKKGGVYQDQLGGPEIFKETKNSTFSYIFGRYYFDDTRFIVKYAGVKAWNRTFTEKELGVIPA